MTEEKRVLDAIETGDAGALRESLRRNPQLAETRDARGLSAVMLAQYHRRPDLVAVLLAHEPHLEIHESAALGMTRRVERILREQSPLAEAHAVDGYTPLHLACMFGHLETVRRLLDHGVRVDAPADNPSRAQPLHVAVSGRWPDIVTELLARGAPVNARQQGGFTALHLAVQNRDEEMVRHLLAAGADPDQRADDHHSPRDMAAEVDNNAMLRILGVHGA